jgi:NADH oxidase (H2O-forming)
MNDNKVLKLSDSVNWIGVLDQDIVTFDIVMETTFGTTYNSYFIDAEKKAVIDTVKESFQDEFIGKIKSLTDPSEIEIIVVNHTEPDHSGNVKNLLKLAPKAKVYGSRQAINYLNEIINEPFDTVIVKDQDTVSLGNKTLRFISAPNLHWPDTIYTYLEEEQLLFTCDSFGAHYCNKKMFDDEVENYDEAYKYYFDVILKPFSKFMLKAIEKIEALKINMICPGHGPILRSNWKSALEKTKELAEQYLTESVCDENNVLITYVSAYGFTKKMAEIIANSIREKIECEIKLVDIENILLGELEEYIVKSNAILIGSPTINQNTVLPIYKLFSVINPIRDKGKKAAAFGSYGWSGEAVKLIEDYLKMLKLDIVLEGVSSRFSPSEDEERSIREFGQRFAEKLLTE